MSDGFFVSYLSKGERPEIIFYVQFVFNRGKSTNTQGYQISLPSLNSRGFSLKITIIVLSFFVIRQVNSNIYLEKNYYSWRKLEKLLFEIFFGRRGVQLLRKKYQENTGKLNISLRNLSIIQI